MLERGKRDPTLKYLKQFAKLTEIPVAVLLWEPHEQRGKATSNQDLYSRLSALMAQYANSVGVKRNRAT